MQTTRHQSYTSSVIMAWTCCKTLGLAVRGLLAASSMSCAVDLTCEKGFVCTCHHELNAMGAGQSPFLGRVPSHVRCSMD